MKAGDWVSVDEDYVFKVHSIEGEFVMVDEVHGYKKDACTLLETEECRKCRKQVPKGQVYERYSFGVYAGKMCDDCAYNGYRDHCGLDGEQGDPADLDEPLEPEPYYGMEKDGW